MLGEFMKFYQAETYQGICESLFLQYKPKIQERLPDAVIEHVGASSIPGTISKGDLDIFVGVEPQRLEKAVEILGSLGFQEKADTLRTSELCMLETTAKEDVAIQVVAKGSAFEFFLHFRDKLRSDVSLVKQYNELKVSCEGESQKVYRAKKSAFIERVLSMP
ncbi:conserved hypothetical protein [Vibrio nigripulchritudo SO65]|nr:conserved hypothetical protein [Vibrio nigripulchritudo AM115]CCN44959.1 conserved hypothetical protein [Vibrio nigripulchritudo FTn2]CCN79714.1 conserved hypothetical protein [Vibrio nigripulchritudo SO65]